jgi:hypothetical protein
MSGVAEHDRPVPGTAHLRQRRTTAQRGDVKGIEGPSMRRFSSSSDSP